MKGGGRDASADMAGDWKKTMGADAAVRKGKVGCGRVERGEWRVALAAEGSVLPSHRSTAMRVGRRLCRLGSIQRFDSEVAEGDGVVVTGEADMTFGVAETFGDLFAFEGIDIDLAEIRVKDAGAIEGDGGIGEAVEFFEVERTAVKMHSHHTPRFGS